jgi:DNA-binding XRE family transcriptional regulator
MSNKEFLKCVGMEIRLARIRQGISQVQLAKKTGLNKGTVSLLELGRTDAQLLTYKRICDLLCISMKDIL